MFVFCLRLSISLGEIQEVERANGHVLALAEAASDLLETNKSLILGLPSYLTERLA